MVLLGYPLVTLLSKMAELSVGSPAGFLSVSVLMFAVLLGCPLASSLSKMVGLLVGFQAGFLLMSVLPSVV